MQSKGAHSKAAILEAAKRLIAEKGFNAITVQDVLDAARVTKGKFFHYFKSKDALFIELLHDSLSEREFLNFAEILKDAPSRDPFEQLLHLLDCTIEWHGKGLPESMRLCVFATIFFSPQSKEMKEISRHLEANTALLEELFKKSQQQGSLPGELDAQTMALLFPSASVGGNTIGYMARRKKLTLENLQQLRTILVTFNRLCKDYPQKSARSA